MVLVLTNVIDWLYTDSALALGGAEANPLMNLVLQRYGMTGIAWTKATVIGVLGFLFLWIHLERLRWKKVRFFFYFAVFIYACLTGYHVLWYSWVN